MNKMGMKEIFERFTRTEQSAEETVRALSRLISDQASEKNHREFMSMIEGMICAGELALAVHSLRTEYDEHDISDVEIDKQLAKLEERFGKEIDKLL